jgi:mono/diheme cytochrome c family protein
MRRAPALLLAMVVLQAVTPEHGYSQPGAAVFQARCAKCHGAAGATDTPMARALKVAPLVNDAKLARMTPAEIAALVRSDTKHRGVVDLEDADLEAAALFVKKLATQSPRK